MKREINRLEEITGKKVEKHRSHFLRIRFPDTFNTLIKLGIKEDYSLGFSTVNGFRAGTATPFNFFDLGKNEATSLRLHPFIFMDSAMSDHLELKPEEAERNIKKLIEKVRKWGGEATGIWHNYALSEDGRYKGWQRLFSNIMEFSAK